MASQALLKGRDFPDYLGSVFQEYVMIRTRYVDEPNGPFCLAHLVHPSINIHVRCCPESVNRISLLIVLGLVIGVAIRNTDNVSRRLRGTVRIDEIQDGYRDLRIIPFLCSLTDEPVNP